MTTPATRSDYQRWGVTCKACHDPAFVVIGPRPGMTDVVTVSRCQHLDGTPLKMADPLVCDSCGEPYAPEGVEPSTKWVLLNVECPACGCIWPTPEGLEAHQCVHGTRCQDDPEWRADLARFGTSGDARDVQAVKAAIGAAKAARQPRGRPKKA